MFAVNVPDIDRMDDKQMRKALKVFMREVNMKVRQLDEEHRKEIKKLKELINSGN